MSVELVLYYDKKTRYSLNPLIAVADKVRGVRVYLAKTLNELTEAIRRLSEKNSKCVVGFSLLTTMLVDESFLEGLRLVVRYAGDRQCITVAGGPHASGDPVGTLKSLGFKVVFIGEAEKSFKDFLNSLVDKGDLSSVRGIAFYEGDRLVFTGRSEPIVLDEYDPFPYWRGIFHPLEITRGCPHGCFYCQVSYMHGMRYRHRSIEKIAYYASEMIKAGMRDFRFITPDGLSYGLKAPSREPDTYSIELLLSSLYKLAGGVGGRIFYGSFPSEVRPEHVTSDAVRILKKYVSNREIIMGAQSGSDRMLRMINRGHTVEDVINAARILVENGFTPSVDVILGIPGETREDQEATLELAAKIIEMGGRIHLHYYLPLPGSPLGLRRPADIPDDIERRISRLIGSGKAYGSWFTQKTLSREILRLHERGVIMPTKT